MPRYRFDHMSHRDRRVRAEEVDCADDAQAMAYAYRLDRRFGVAVWRDQRLVGFVAFP